MKNYVLKQQQKAFGSFGYAHCKREIASDSYLYLVDDGSKDKTWEIIEHLHSENPDRIKGLKFIRNYGNQKALIAGLEGVRELGCDCVVSIDADLQQDELAIEKFIDEYEKDMKLFWVSEITEKQTAFSKNIPLLCFTK